MRTVSRLIPAVVAACSLAGGLAACNGEPSTASLRAQGDKAMARGDAPTAVEKYAAAVAKNPEMTHLRIKHAEALMAADRPAEAREQLWVAHTLDLRSEEVFEALIDALYATGEHDQLFSLLRQRAMDDKSLDGYYRLADYAVRLGDPDAAERALMAAAIADRGRSVEPQLHLADFYAEMGNTDKALDRLRMALYLRPESVEIADRIRAMGRVPGPTFALKPAEAEGP